MTPDDLLAKFADDSGSLTADELGELQAALARDPQLAVQLKEQLVFSDLLSRRLAGHQRQLDRQLAQRLREPAEHDRFVTTLLARLPGDDQRPPGQAAPAPSPGGRAAAVGVRWLAVAAGLALAVAGGLWFQRRPAPLGLRLAAFQGAVTVTHAGQPVPVSQGLALYAGDGVTVTAGGTAVLQYDGEATRLELHAVAARSQPEHGAAAGSRTPGPSPSVSGGGQPTTIATFGAEKGAKRVNLAAGTLVCTAAPQKLPLEIQTPQAVARVVGTSFTLQADAAATRLEVRAGLVRLTRAQDNAAVDVPAGHEAIVASGAELRAKPIRPPGLLLDLDVEDRILPERTVGTVVECPAALGGSRFCVAGKYDGRLFRVNIRNGNRALLTYRDGAVLSFDYWVKEYTGAIDVYFWNETRSVSRGFVVRDPAQEHWTHVTKRLSDFAKEAWDGDLIWDLSIQTTPGGNELFVDNIRIETADKP